jgi:hypothetical protein
VITGATGADPETDAARVAAIAEDLRPRLAGDSLGRPYGTSGTVL